MLLNPQNLYFELGRLLAQMPDLTSGRLTPEIHRWLASANALLRFSGSLADALQLKVTCENLDSPLRARNAQMIVNILHRVFAKAELDAPREVQGSVLLIGKSLHAHMAMRQLLRTASNNALLVAPDAVGKILADYAILAPDRVTIRLLADEAQYKPSLIAGIARWEQRFGDQRNLLVRLASANSLHERLILLDCSRAWVLGVPFNELSRRAHTALVRMRPEEEVRKLAMYAEIWEEAKPAVTAELSVNPHSRAAAPAPLTNMMNSRRFHLWKRIDTPPARNPVRDRTRVQGGGQHARGVTGPRAERC
jgi:hypothetical protein